MPRRFRLLFVFFLACGALKLANAQSTLTCTPTGGPPVVKAEGITERLGDLFLNCSGGAANAQVTINLTIFLTVNITNRVNDTTLSDVIFTIDTGAGPQPANVPAILTAPNTMVFNGVSFRLSSSGAAVLRVANIRGAANRSPLGPNGPITAFLGLNGSSVTPLTNSQVAIGVPMRGLYGSMSSKIICAPNGSPFPDNTRSFAAFLASRAIFNSTRVTEGFADAFQSRNDAQGLNADTGMRIMVSYAGFPPGARLFVPDVIAGSDTLQPTAGGDYGFVPSGGRYAPGGNGSLLLSRVFFTDANGAGGSVAFFPGPAGSGPVSFDGMSEVPLVNGFGIAVFEVVDDNPFGQEFAQFPTFLGLPPNVSTPTTTLESISLAPVSTVMVASHVDPIPRFQSMPPPQDCTLIGDCGANYFPKLFVNAPAQLTFTEQTNSNTQVAYIPVNNQGGGVMFWTATVSYINGSGWLRIDPTDAVNNGTIRVDAIPTNLAPGIYQAVLTVDAGSVAGSRSVPITLTITPAPPPPPQTPVVASVLNGASFAPGALAPGSLATLMGSKLAGSKVSVAFDGMPAKILYDSDTQINLYVPMELGAKTSAQMLVTVDGLIAPTQSVALSPFTPAIFRNGVLNQDYSVNSPDHSAGQGTIVQIFATGLSGNGTITAKLNGQTISAPYYGGPAPGLLGVQQVDLQLPTNLPGPTASIAVCGGTTPDQQVCSPTIQITVSQ
ncbi:MAG TPA: hypothetical protein VEU96_04215 [Bryobacteraceae bacterium]|nr:hypothetical protein [Bryobacteraceae bacterium]